MALVRLTTFDREKKNISNTHGAGTQLYRWKLKMLPSAYQRQEHKVS